ncbi:sugar phosphate isomerase/epimerase [Bacillus sp. FJAT-49732]|uniref:Sugar phosphate isomerase/epimerase n=1 Tax=Lederbergia citrisecunda TaxID=2833583 RepID=A0A942THL4_9BACI|nr:sugar phosphate isomerase/epimerase family protein [Lederbergia citrisecunda]MBS4198221.1 sugar phosphate isomerase/epimerase [Lederbergia citrisecunda]
MLKSINQWCYPEGTPIEKVFEYSRNAGFDAVELNLNEAGGVGLTVETTKEEAEKILALAKEYELQLRSLSTSLLWKTPLSSPDESVRREGIRVVEKMLEIASFIGIDTILLVPGAVSKEVSYDECYERSQEAIKQIIPIAEKFSVKIGIENVWNKFLLSPLEMARYIDELDSEYIGAYFDVGNVLQFGFPEQWIKILGKRIFKVHVKDFSTSVGNITGFVPLLAGDVDWKSVKNALEQIGYKDTLTAELSPYALCPSTLADDTARHLDVILRA